MTADPLTLVPAPLRTALEERGFSALTAVQEAALATCGESRDLRISSQTGSGKTVALGLVTAPTLLSDAEAEPEERVRGPLVLVIVPTRELAAQVRTELTWLYAGVPSVTLDCVTGGTNPGHERGRLQDRPRVLVGTPGRLLDHLTSGALSLADVKHLVLDEADQMLDMGFREDLEAILDATPEERRTHLVSATFPDAILRLAERYQKDSVHVEGTTLGEANQDIEHLGYRVRGRDRYAAIVNLLLINQSERTLIFVSTRAQTAELAEQLTEDGFRALPLSGELAQVQRTRTLAAFKNGLANVLVATDVASRGLDLPDVSTVLHAAPPIDGEVYTHRSGRTGRAGQKGQSLLLVPPSKERRVRWMLSQAKIDIGWRAIPTEAQVKKALSKRARRATFAAIDEAPEATEERREEAERLLEGRDPAQVVATLLDLTRPSSGPAPKALGAAPPASREDREAPRHGVLRPAPRSEDEAREALAEAVGGTTRFFINWGREHGAIPKRILAHVCRRGGIEGKDVGAIRISDRMTTFDVKNHVARSFEERASERDRRDPHLRIERARTGRDARGPGGHGGHGGHGGGGFHGRGSSDRGGPRHEGGDRRGGGFHRGGGFRRDDDRDGRQDRPYGDSREGGSFDRRGRDGNRYGGGFHKGGGSRGRGGFQDRGPRHGGGARGGWNDRPRGGERGYDDREGGRERGDKRDRRESSATDSRHSDRERPPHARRGGFGTRARA